MASFVKVHIERSQGNESDTAKHGPNNDLLLPFRHLVPLFCIVYQATLFLVVVASYASCCADALFFTGRESGRLLGKRTRNGLHAV